MATVLEPAPVAVAPAHSAQPLSPARNVAVDAYRGFVMLLMMAEVLRLARVAVSMLSASARAASLKAGVAKVDITPQPGLRLWGFESRKSPATGTRDPLYARVLVLEAGDARLALVALDLGRVFGPASLDFGFGILD